MKENESIAILMRKIKLPSNLYLYMPVTHVIGIFDAETNTFNTRTDTYINIENDNMDAFEHEYAVIKPCSYQRLKEIYPTENEDINIEECIDSYINQNLDTLCFTSYNYDNDELDTLFYNAEDIFNTSFESESSFNDEQSKKSNEGKNNSHNLETIDEKFNYINIEELYNKVTSTIVAQDEHVRRLVLEICRMELTDQRNGILLTGPTGVGKTELIKTIGKYINREVYIVDSTQLTTPGYTGLSIEEVLYDLYTKCKANKERTENAIIVFDEIDKKGSQNKDDISGRAVLNTLLKFLDGTIYKATENTRTSSFCIDIDTSKMIVVASGAFTDVYKTQKAEIGFYKTINIKDKKPTYDDFCSKAMMPDEFMGRFPIIINLNDLKIEDLKKILTDSDKSCLKNQQVIFEKCNTTLKVDEDFINEVAKKAYELKTGARSLSSIINEVTWLPLEQVMKERNIYSSVELTKETVYDPKVYKLVRKKQNKQK